VINVKDNVREVIAFTDRFSKNARFATALALTRTVQGVAAAMPGEVAKSLDRPTEFTKRGFTIERADKRQALQASVVVKRLQAQYLQWQVFGGRRTPRRKALKLPSDVQLDASGNIGRREFKALLAQAKRDSRRKAGKQAKGRASNNSGSTLFYGQPKGRTDLPAGIYRREESAQPSGRKLVPLVVFPARPADYRPRFAFHDIAERMVRRTFVTNLRAAWERAKATAR
jgi:hypothetical protein